jgi:UDP-glucose 4-epimerase
MRITMRRALITGGSGFLGEALTNRLLCQNWDVSVYDLRRPRCNEICFIQGDVLDVEGIRKAAARIDVIFHLAGVLGTDYLCDHAREAIHVNLEGTLNVFDTARIHNNRVINVGVIPEWDNPYMITKKAAMRLGRSYYKVHKIDITTIEMTHIYGPGQRLTPYKKAIPSFIACALKNDPLTIYGSGRRYMDCLYVSDAVDVLQIATEDETLSGQVLRTLTGAEITVIELARKIIALTDSRSRLELVPMRQGEPEIGEWEGPEEPWVRFPSKNWRPEMTLDQGLKRTIESFKELMGQRN